jgi:hypothetical protein
LIIVEINQISNKKLDFKIMARNQELQMQKFCDQEYYKNSFVTRSNC